MDYGAAGTALTSGILFGYVLEQAGFASPGKLTAQFRFTDWSVFKVMFTAILVAAVGILLLQIDDSFGSRGFYIPGTALGAVVAGGVFIGAGMAIGGYCPGTSVVGAMSGRIDGLVFALGMILGIWGFSFEFDTAWMQQLLHSGEIRQKTIPALFGISPWMVVAALTALALVIFLMGSRLERRLREARTTPALSIDTHSDS
ncbi:MAG: YeeE/YedE thiosulfate transporter family protein [Candidatus Thiodiazotropha sp.]